MPHSKRTPEQREKYNAYMREYGRRNADRMNARRRERRKSDPLYDEHVRALSRERIKRYQATEKGKETARRSQAARRARKLGVRLTDPCSYCGGVAEVRDHIVPVAKGGTDSWDNLTPACGKCNAEKGDTSLLMFLLEQAA